jgi:hypothetical protein
VIITNQLAQEEEQQIKVISHLDRKVINGKQIMVSKLVGSHLSHSQKTRTRRPTGIDPHADDLPI